MSRAKMSSKYARSASRPSSLSGALGVFWASATSMVASSAYSAVSAAPSRSENARRSAAPARGGGGGGGGERAPQRGAVQRGVGGDGGHGRTVAGARPRAVNRASSRYRLAAH